MYNVKSYMYMHVFTSGGKFELSNRMVYSQASFMALVPLVTFIDRLHACAPPRDNITDSTLLYTYNTINIYLHTIKARKAFFLFPTLEIVVLLIVINELIFGSNTNSVDSSRA